MSLFALFNSTKSKSIYGRIPPKVAFNVSLLCKTCFVNIKLLEGYFGKSVKNYYRLVYPIFQNISVKGSYFPLYFG